MRNYIKFHSFIDYYQGNNFSGNRVFCVRDPDDAPSKAATVMADIRPFGITENIVEFDPWYFLISSERIADMISALGAAIAYDDDGNPTGMPVQTSVRPYFGQFDGEDWYQVESPKDYWSNGR